MYNFYSNPTLVNCAFANNSASFGGGMFNNYSSPTLIGCSFAGNLAYGSKSQLSRGGGMFNFREGSPTLTDCTFTSNNAYSGGGMYNQSSSPNLTGCTFSGNSASLFDGGGIAAMTLVSSARRSNWWRAA